MLVVPLVSRHGDTFLCRTEMGIDHLEWHLDESREATIVLVGAEAASSKDFISMPRGD